MPEALPADLQALMQQAASLPAPDLPTPWPDTDQTPDQWREQVAATRIRHEQWSQEMASKLAGGGGTPGAELPAPPAPLPVAEVRDVKDGQLAARVYFPEGVGPFPAVVMLHGGGFWIGGGPVGLAAADPGCRMICVQLGAVVVNVDYRQAPEHQFPIPLEDSYAALQWTASLADVDPERIAVMGPSAGANLAAAVALLARDRGGPAIRFLSLMVPCLDGTLASPSIEENGAGFELTKGYVETAWRLYLGKQERTQPLASPLHATDLAGLPETHIAVAEFDPLRDDGIRYAQRLAAAGVAVSLSRYPMGHSVMTPAVGSAYLGEVLAKLGAALTA